MAHDVHRHPEGDRRCKLRSSLRALVVLVYLRKHEPLAQIAAAFKSPEGTVHAYTSAAVDLLAERAPGSLLKALREADLDHVLGSAARSGDILTCPTSGVPVLVAN